VSALGRLAEEATKSGGLAAAWQVVLGVVSGGALAKVTDWLLSRRRGDAETDSVVVKTATEWITTMRQDLMDMRSRLAEMDQRLSEAEIREDAYRRRVNYLTEVLRQHDITIEDWSAPR